MKKEISYPVEIFNTINPSELADNKIWIDIQPIDSWDSWAYKIYLEDCMSPFFMIHSDGNESHYKGYSHALTNAIDWLENNQYIIIVDLPF